MPDIIQIEEVCLSPLGENRSRLEIEGLNPGGSGFTQREKNLTPIFGHLSKDAAGPTGR